MAKIHNSLQISKQFASKLYERMKYANINDVFSISHIWSYVSHFTESHIFFSNDMYALGWAKAFFHLIHSLHRPLSIIYLLWIIDVLFLE